MTGRIEARLAELGIALPVPKAPAGTYVPFVEAGGLVFVSGQVSMGPDGPITGQLGPGDHVDGAPAEGTRLAAAVMAARQSGLSLIAQAKAAVGDLDRIARVVKLTGFVNSAPGFAQQPLVINGASDLMVEVFGEAGRHARAAVGSSALPLDVMVEIEGVFAIA